MARCNDVFRPQIVPMWTSCWVFTHQNDGTRRFKYIYGRWRISNRIREEPCKLTTLCTFYFWHHKEVKAQIQIKMSKKNCHSQLKSQTGFDRNLRALSVFPSRSVPLCTEQHCGRRCETNAKSTITSLYVTGASYGKVMRERTETWR